MIQATKPNTRTYRSCDRCGITIHPDSTGHCTSCLAYNRGENITEGQEAKKRRRARREGWDYDAPHLGQWGTNG